MTAGDLARRASSVNPSIAILLVLTGLAAGMVLAALAGPELPRLSVLALVLAGGLLVHIPVLWGGSVPIGYALLIAMPSIVPLDEGALVVVAALLVVGGVTVATHGTTAAGPPLVRLGACAVAATIGSVVVGSVVAEPLAQAVGAALLLVPAELAITRRIAVDGATIEIRSALPVLLTVACGAALITVARSEVGWEMTAIAAFPLLITRFSFRRSADAQQTLRQTVQALGLVPELAGLAPVGRSERSATYARRLARHLGCTRATEERIVTACRLQHLGAVPEHGRADGAGADAGGAVQTRAEMAAQGGRILEEAGFPDEVVRLVRRAGTGDVPGLAPDLEAAIVEVASSFDHLVGDDLRMVSQGLGSVTAAACDPATRRVAAALVELAATEPDLVGDAIAAGATFRAAASGFDLDELEPVAGSLLPFSRRDRTAGAR